MTGVVVVGDINIDVIMPIPAFPQSGGEAVTEGMITSVGGSAANTAITLAKSGIAVRMIGRVGRDLWGEMTLATLGACGVDTALVQRDDQAPTGMMFTPVTPDGERTMFGQRGANVRTEPAEIGEGALAGARFLHLSGYALLEPPQRDAALRTVALAEKAGIPIGLDTAWLPAFRAPGQILDLLPKLAICVLGVEEAALLSGGGTAEAAARRLVEAGADLVGLKMGHYGCLLADKSGIISIPPFHAEAVDSTGAGDAFSAGLICGHLKGLSLPAAGLLANALGSLAVRVWGAGNSLPGEKEVRTLLEERLLAEAGELREWIKEALCGLDYSE
jgi:ribokinase